MSTTSRSIAEIRTSAAMPGKQFDAVFDDACAVYARCKSVFGAGSVIMKAAEHFARQLVADEPLERWKALADATA